ncbi:MAG: hypothetical protein N3D82_02395 [Ignisphaera sp.]|nr:hypothetical protein [Ignisphaera sp.]MCX8167867.1 hypothetical protein [Ignisphaera sp.]MDW8085492.1 hypothetical protein [Ignisphaera sp.]
MDIDYHRGYGSNLSKTLYVTLKIFIEDLHIDELCYGIYSLFKNDALSIAIERPFCNRVVIVGKDFEVRFFNSIKNDSIISIALEVRDSIFKNVMNFLSNVLVQISRILPKGSLIDKNVKLGIHTTIKVDQINVEELCQKLFNLSIVLDRTEDRVVEGFPIMVIRGSTIGYDLRRYEITIAMLTSERVELSITIETYIYLDKILNGIIYINELINIIAESVDSS